MQNDIPSKLIDYKKQISELRSIINTKEREKDQFLSNYELGNDYYSKSILERQANEIVNLQKAVEEYERRDSICEKRWQELMNENQLNTEHSSMLKSQLEQQRESYNRLLSMTEKRVIQANDQICQVYQPGPYDFVEENKRAAAQYLSQQIYELYEDRRKIMAERDQIEIMNNDL